MFVIGSDESHILYGFYTVALCGPPLLFWAIHKHSSELNSVQLSYTVAFYAMLEYEPAFSQWE